MLVLNYGLSGYKLREAGVIFSNYRVLSMSLKITVDRVTCILRACLCPVLIVLACGACSMQLRPVPESPTDLSGQWQLPAAQRDAIMVSLHEKLDQARTKLMQRELKSRSRYCGPDGSVASAGDNAPPSVSAQSCPSAVINNWQVRDQQRQHEELLNTVVPGMKLRIVHTSNRIELLPDSSAPRRFETGMNSLLVTSYATMKVESGWQGNVFVVHSEDVDQGLNIIERYQREAPDKLSVQVQLDIPDLNHKVFSVTYEISRDLP